MRILVPFTALLALLTLSSSTPAVELSGRSRTFLQSREAVDKSDIMPFFEFLDFRAEDLGAGEVSFHFGGWFRYDLRDDSAPGKDRNSDLQYAFVRIRGERADAALDLGRVAVNEGVASEQVDGAYARTDLPGGFTVAAFGGAPVETAFDDRSGDSVYGGRLVHGAGGVYRVGLSYLKERNGRETDNGKEVSRVFREESGVDLWLRPIDTVEILGDAFYNSITDNWMYRSAYVTLGPFAGVRATGQAVKVLYRDYFTSVTTAAFRFDPAVVDPAEEMLVGGGELSYTVSGITLSGDYRKYHYEKAGDADHAGGGIAYTAQRKGGMGAAWHRMDGDTNRLRYDEYRVYAYLKFGAFDVAADYLDVRYDVEINGVRNASAASLAGGYDMTKDLRLAADVEYARSPNYDKDVRGLVKLVYNFSFAGPAGPAAPAPPAATGKERKGK